jgi:hypothetical protein
MKGRERHVMRVDWVNDADPEESFARLVTCDQLWFSCAIPQKKQQSSSKKGLTSADTWKTTGIRLLGYTRNPAHQLASSGCDSEQQHIL